LRVDLGIPSKIQSHSTLVFRHFLFFTKFVNFAHETPY